MTRAAIDLVLAPARPFAIQALARSLDQGSRRFASAAELEQLVALAPEDLDGLLGWATAHGLDYEGAKQARPIRRLCLRATVEQLGQAFGDAALRALAHREAGAPAIASADALPPRLRGLVARIELSPDSPDPWRRRARASLHDDDEYPHRDPPPPRPTTIRAVTPTCFANAVAAPAKTDGAGQRIALMALGGLPRARDLEVFRAGFELPPSRLRFVQLGPMSAATRDDPLFRHETTMTIEWITAIASAAELSVYLIDPYATADPWVAFFEAALADHATIATTAWSSPELQYYASHGRAVAASLLDQLAAIGCTVLAASGDWGACAGAPRARSGDALVCARPWPGVAFPCTEPRVLGVGGTMGFATPELFNAELSPDLAARLGLRRVATGGGFSEFVAIPPWQIEALATAYPRDDAPAIPPSGRGVPDLALPAWGLPAGSGPTGVGDWGFGYWGFIDGRWRSDLGGTSLSAALAAACFARVNQALESHGRLRVGCVGPRLYALARRAEAGTALQPVARGTSSVALPCLDAHGRVRWQTIPGFRADLEAPGWNPGAGLGLANFTDLLAEWLADPG